MPDDDAMRRMINAIEVDMPDGDINPSDLEAISEKVVTKKRRASNKLFVQKIVTEIYVYTDMAGKGVGEIVSQKLFILGDMTETKLKRLIAAERRAEDNTEPS